MSRAKAWCDRLSIKRLGLMEVEKSFLQPMAADMKARCHHERILRCQNNTILVFLPRSRFENIISYAFHFHRYTYVGTSSKCKNP